MEGTGLLMVFPGFTLQTSAASDINSQGGRQWALLGYLASSLSLFLNEVTKSNTSKLNINMISIVRK